MMEENFVIDAIQSAFNLEIVNPYRRTKRALIVKMKDGTDVVIMAPHIDDPKGERPRTLPTNFEQHTFQYVHQNDTDEDFYNEEEPDTTNLTKIELLSFEDCRCYMEDACQTFFDCQFNDFELSFDTGDAYLVTMMPYKMLDSDELKEVEEKE